VLPRRRPRIPSSLIYLSKNKPPGPVVPVRAAKGGTSTLLLKPSQAPVTEITETAATRRSHGYRPKNKVDKPPGQKRI